MFSIYRRSGKALPDNSLLRNVTRVSRIIEKGRLASRPHRTDVFVVQHMPSLGSEQQFTAVFCMHSLARGVALSLRIVNSGTGFRKSRLSPPFSKGVYGGI